MTGVKIAKGGAGHSGLSPPALHWDGSTRLRLGVRWALSADNLQWILLKARNHKGRTKWQPVSYISTNKAVLRRVLREEGVELCPDGERALNALNESFREWREQQHG
tara:strand:+ start:1645 stop:1965 length:321 start_codon:yes stop_codon:yes gene_type:complete